MKIDTTGSGNERVSEQAYRDADLVGLQRVPQNIVEPQSGQKCDSMLRPEAADRL